MQKKGKFILMSTDEFGQWLFDNRFNRVIKLLQNHHTYLPGYAQFKGNNHFALLNSMESAHLERGFSQIAQNLTTFPDGTVAVCRPLDTIPAGIKGANQAGICIENLGNFDSGGDAITIAHHAAIIEINALLCREFALTPNTDTIVYHHWYDLETGKRTNGAGNTKTCPGSAFFGGNSVENAAADFIPLIKAALAQSGGHAPASIDNARTAEVTASSLNVRNAPGTLGVVVKSLPHGIIVKTFEQKNGWYRIHPSEQHWVFGKYLQFM